MTKIIWIIFALFVIGNSFFVLPLHLSSDSIVNSHVTNYKTDSFLLHTVFPDSVIPIKLNMPTLYDALYYKNNSPVVSKAHPPLIVNVSFLDDLGFFSLMFPFYKSINCIGDISFYSIVKIGDQPARDSTALIGNIKINLRLSVKGICTPLYVRTLVEKEFIDILRKEMDKVEKDINKPAIADTNSLEKPIEKVRPSKHTKVGKKIV